MSDYTFEDYLKDFELDYLGFDGVPPQESVPVSRAETAADAEEDDLYDDIHSPCLRFQR